MGLEALGNLRVLTTQGILGKGLGYKLEGLGGGAGEFSGTRGFERAMGFYGTKPSML